MARLVAPLVLVACLCVVSFLRTIDEQAISYLQAARIVLALYHRKMILAELFRGGKDNIHA